MDHRQFLEDLAGSLGQCGAPFGVRITFGQPCECKHFSVVSSVQDGKLYVSLVYPTGQTYQVTTQPASNVQMSVISAANHLSVVFDDPCTQVIYESVDDRETGVGVEVSQRGAYVRLLVHLPHGSRCGETQQMPTVVSAAWVDQIAMLHGFVRDRDVTGFARRRNMIYRHEISTAAESLGMMTPAAARKKGWASPDDLAQHYEYVGPAAAEFNAALAAWEATLKPTADSAAAAGEASSLEAAVDMGAAAPADGAKKASKKAAERPVRKKIATGRKRRKTAKKKTGK